MTRAVIYCRYSSDLQRDTSIEDQLRVCTEKAANQGWQITNTYSDAGISGASLVTRPGIQALIQDAMAGQFDIVLAEAMDRLSRDQEDIAGIHKRMEFAGVRIITLAEGEINTMHIGLKGTMNALFLKDLADKTRRGLRGKIENSKSAGGISYGYRVATKINAKGETIKGDREINENEASIVRRIFEEYTCQNKSPKAIAADLNKDGIPCPSGSAWGQSTINGNRKRGTGILNNDLYHGVLVWNRQKFIKDPNSGKRVSRINPESEWITKDVPELRIVSDELWQEAKNKQSKLDRKYLRNAKRPKYLLAGLLECGSCGGGYSKTNSERYGCSNAKNKGETVCTNRKTIKQVDLEDYVLEGLKDRLMRPDLIELYCEEYHRHLDQLIADQEKLKQSQLRERTKFIKERDNLIQAIKDGLPASMVQDDLKRVSEQLESIEKAMLDAAEPPRPLLDTSAATRYQELVDDLLITLRDGQSQREAMEHIRALIEKIILKEEPGRKDLRIDLYGDLAGILNLSTGANMMQKEEKEHFGSDLRLPKLEKSQILQNVVAGAGFEPTTFGL